MKKLASVIAFLAAAFGSFGAIAQSDQMFAGKTITIYVGYTAGGGYDQYARNLARYLGRHIPGNPSVLIENMPGAATLLAVRHLDANAPTDGTALAMFDPGLITSSLATPETIKIKLSNYRWAGTLARDARVCYASVSSGVKDWNSLLTQTKFMMGATAKGADAYVNGAVLRKVFHAPVSQIGGYPGSNEQRLAVQRGELEGACASWASLPPDWLANRTVNILVRFSQKLQPGMAADIPWIVDLAKTPEQKQLLTILNAPGELGRPFIVAKSVPEANLAILRRGFQATIADPAFQHDLQTQNLPLDPIAGEEAEKMVANIYSEAASNPSLVDQIKDVLN